MTQPYGRIGVVVVESGGAAAGHLEAIRAIGAEPMVLKQRAGELPETFARRCRKRIGEVLESGASVAEARLVEGARKSSEMILARAALVRTLVAPMARAGCGKMVLVSADEDSNSMRALASIVGEQSRGTGIDVAFERAGSAGEAESRLHDARREPRA